MYMWLWCWFVLGYGVVVYKVIKDLCRLFGIKDIYIKLEGNIKNRITMITVFFNVMIYQVYRLCKIEDE